jgi:class 3 adenylate cyclase/tetratricopeptide (TPR) repeat protein
VNCPRCKNQNPDTAAFCDECGTPLETACSSCGEVNRRGAKFCKKCGQSLSRPAIATQSIAANISQRQPPIPKYLAEKILAERHTLEGERKQVTILFADIKDSTRLVEGLDPEDAQKLLDPILKAMMDAVHRYEGTVNHILGDGIMALFGAPLAHEDHAVRACYAALAMQQQLRRYADEVGPSAELPQIRIGLNSGEVVVRTIDNDLNFDYLAVGDSIHLAARMQELASPGAVFMTGRTLREVEGFVQVNSLGLLQAKGFVRPIETFELTGVTAARKRLHAAAARGLSGFVGRTVETEIFKRVREQASSGHGQILALCGEAGMGKSRLVYEFTHSHLPPEWTVLEATSASYGKATPYYPLMELLRRYFQIHEGESLETIRLKVQTHLIELDPRLKDTIPPLLALLDALPDAENSEKTDTFGNKKDLEISELIKKFEYLEPQQRRRLTFEALKRVVIRESLNRPILLLMEDLHWIDSETQAFLDHLVESLPRTRLLLLVNHRPGYSHSWSDKSYYTQIRVDPLSDQGAEELVRVLLGDNEDLVSLKRLLIKRTEGNPFFVEESVRSLVESGFLVGDKGHYRAGLKIDSIRIPSTVQTVLADRIDRLAPPEKHLLQMASAIGVIVPLALLRAVAELPEDELYRHLGTLRSAEFLYESNLFPDLEYTFKHALTNEVAYGALLHDRRTALHARIVNALEETAKDSSPEQWDQLAHHAFLGELWDRAVNYLREAGGQAVSRSSFRHAIFFYERALEALQHLPESVETLRLAVDLRFELRNALFILGNFQQGFRYLEEAKTYALKLNDRGRLGMLYNFMTAFWNLEGNSERAVTSGKQALEYTEGPEQLDLSIVAHYFLGVAYHNLGFYSEANDELRTALAAIGERRFDQFGTAGIVSVICKSWLVRGLAQLGRFEEAMPFLEQAIQTAIEREHPYSLVYAYYAAGVLFLIKGEFGDAIKRLESGLAVCEASNIVVQRPLVVSCLSDAYAYAGRFADAIERLESESDHRKWIEGTGGQQLPFGKAMRMVWSSEAYLLTGRTNDAKALALHVLQVLRNGKDKGSEAWLLRILGDVDGRRTPFNAAQGLARYTAAFQLANELGMRPLQAHCYLGLGQLHACAEDFARARSELRKALELYQDLAMDFWLPSADAALRALG